MKLLIICLLISGLSACATTGQDNVCGAFTAIYLTKPEVKNLSDDSIRQVLTHNELGLRLGCWDGRKRAL